MRPILWILDFVDWASTGRRKIVSSNSIARWVTHADQNSSNEVQSAASFVAGIE